MIETSSMPRPALAGLLATLLAVGCAPGDTDAPGSARDPDGAATLVLRGGSVLTMNPDAPRAEVLAIDGRRIVYVGDETGAETYVGPDTRVVELAGATVLPGLTDAHAHLMGTGRFHTQVDLLGTTTYRALLDSVASAVVRAEPGEWITGRGWHQEKWTDAPDATVRGFPLNDDLDAIAPDNPVSIRHASGHGRLVNSAALAASGITAATPDPAGGEILHRPDGRPTGMLLENAEDMVEEAHQRHLAERTQSEQAAAERAALRAGIDEFLRHGVTSVHTPPADSRAGVSLDEIALYREALADGDLRMRVYAMISASDATPETLDRERTIGAGNGRLTIRAIKAYGDGALGSRGAMLLEPYSDDPSSGEEVSTEAELRRVIDLSLSHGYQAAIHAIGDGANRRVLDLYEEAFASRPDAADDTRFRIEHAQILHPDDVDRFAELGVVAAMQGVHATSDGPWTPTRLGTQRTDERAYLFRDLWDAGVLVVNGTDAPVERVNPWAAIAGMTTGIMANGEVFVPDHLLSREEAIATYTINPARAAFEAEARGSLEVGKLADVTVVDGDPLTVPAAELSNLRTLLTIVDGEVAYEADAARAESVGAIPATGD